VLRFFGSPYGDRLVLVNLDQDLHLRPGPEPLLAPPRGARWEVVWSSEDTRYGGSGTPPMQKTGAWTIPGHSAVVMYERTE
jgi:maltooligosyltrehalose trehalohydrolase